VGFASAANNTTQLSRAAFGWNVVSGNPIGHTIALSMPINGGARYFSTSSTGVNYISLSANSVAGDAQKFILLDAGNGYIAIQSVLTGKFVSADPADIWRLKANATTIGTNEKFAWVDLTNGNSALRSVGSGKYVMTNGIAGDTLRADSDLMPTTRNLFTWQLLL